jgi:hypothetical protein
MDFFRNHELSGEPIALGSGRKVHQAEGPFLIFFVPFRSDLKERNVLTPYMRTMLGAGIGTEGDSIEMRPQKAGRPLKAGYPSSWRELFVIRTVKS